MRLSVIFILIGLVLLGTVSCDPSKKFKSEIAEIDSCLAVLDTIELKFDGIEFDSLAMILEHIVKNESIIKNNYVSDTINEVLGRNLNQCKGIRKYFTDPAANRNKFKREILDLRAQFENLKSDVSNGVLKKDKIDLYITNEKSDLNLFNLSFSEYHDKQIKAFKIYYEIVPQVDAFIEILMKEDEDDNK